MGLSCAKLRANLVTIPTIVTISMMLAILRTVTIPRTVTIQLIKHKLWKSSSGTIIVSNSKKSLKIQMKICCQHFLFIKEFNQKTNICPKIFWWENLLSNKNSTLKNTLVQIYEFVRKIVFEILVRKFLDQNFWKFKKI